MENRDPDQAPPSRIAVIHYHLFPGGVTTSIVNSLDALASSGGTKGCSFTVLCGHDRGVPRFRERVEAFGLDITARVDSSLFYHPGRWADRSAFRVHAERISSLVLEQGKGETLFWIHNPTLGKNPAFTEGLKLAAEAAEEQGLPFRFLYHIHDFPEAGRPGNLAHLQSCHPGGGVTPLFPASSNFGIACINNSDRETLLHCGVPPHRLFYLPNSVPWEGTEWGEKTRGDVSRSLEGFARRNGYRFERDWPWWVMPVRMIRRKNVLEAFLLAALAGDAEVLVTLDANSEPEYPYARRVKAVVAGENLPGVLCFGRELVGRDFSLHDLICACDAVVSTSLMEGFGFAFLEGTLRNRPLTGRNVGEATGDFSRTGLPVSQLYDALYVPLSRESRNRLRDRSIAFARDYAERAELPPEALEMYVQEVHRRYEREVVDFGDLDLESQVSFLPRCRDKAFVEILRNLNPEASRPFLPPPDFPRRVGEEFGPARHARRLREILGALFKESAAEPFDPSAGQRMKERFFTPSRNRPLFWVREGGEENGGFVR